MAVFDGPELSFRALKPVKKDEEIFISYVDVTYPYSHRQQELSESFYFQCKCSKCQKGPETQEDGFLQKTDSLGKHWLHTFRSSSLAEELLMLEHNDENNVSSNSAVSEVLAKVQILAINKLKASHKQSVLEALGSLEDALVLLHQTRMWPEHRQPLPSIRQEVFVKLLAKRSTMLTAFKHGLKLYFDIHPILYPQSFHPVRIVHKWTLAMLAIFLASEKDLLLMLQTQSEELDLGVVIAGLLTEVANNVHLSHGRDSKFARAVGSKLEKVRVDTGREGCGTSSEIRDIIEQQWVNLRHLAGRDDSTGIR